MIQLNNVNKYFNKHKKNEIHVINNTSLEFNKKGLVALLGNSGSGKTTLLNTISGLDRVNSGSIYINGKKITRFSANKIDEIRNLNIGYIFQNYELIDNMSVFDNVALVLKMLGIKDKDEIKKRVEYVLDILGIKRYRYRFASMLSGGERQRVGIARAIVKNPNIIIADEPTGNLDSKNTLEIMNIIKSISKDKLVILVTHEKELAYFYADRIINIEDGNVVSDEVNDATSLDYKIDNKIYLKDIKKKTQVNKENININCYNDEEDKISLDIVIKEDNIYIKSNTNKDIKVVTDDSFIEFVDDHYKKITKENISKYNFDYNKIINNNYKYKYSSIYNFFSLFTNGVKKVFDYSIIKKVLLLGFFVSAMFTLYSISNIFGVLNIKDSSFVTINKEYLEVTTNKLSVENILEYEKNKDINYLLPGDSIVNFKVQYKDYYQTSNILDNLSGSLSSINIITKEDLIYGVMPKDKYEIVVDKLSIDKIYSGFYAKQVGLEKTSDMLNRIVNIDNIKDFKIVGIVNKNSPSIYVDNSLFIDILSNNSDTNNMDYYVKTEEKEKYNKILNYELKKDSITLKEGRYPTNDYETIVNIINKDTIKLNKEIDIKVNNKKLLVVGYYSDIYQNNYYLVNSNTIKYDLINGKKTIMIYPNNKDNVINYFNDKNINIVSSYESSKKRYKNEVKNMISASVISALIILIISLIEIFLMIRSSFLSRIKEVGIYRAIGVKKLDIYKMFLGEIVAITTIASVPGYLIMAYIISKLVDFPYIGSRYMFTSNVLIISITLIYFFNIIVGLLPVFNVIRKTPAQILARNDLE